MLKQEPIQRKLLFGGRFLYLRWPNLPSSGIIQHSDTNSVVFTLTKTEHSSLCYMKENHLLNLEIRINQLTILIVHGDKIDKIIIHRLCIGWEDDSVLIQRPCFCRGVRCQSMPYWAHALLIFRGETICLSSFKSFSLILAWYLTINRSSNDQTLHFKKHPRRKFCEVRSTNHATINNTSRITRP